MTETSMTLDRIWDELVAGIHHDLRRARNRRRVPAVVSAAALMALGSTAAIAAATDLWSGTPAPPSVQQRLQGPKPEYPIASASDAIEVARDGSHILYASPATAGGYCITDDAQTGTWCSAGHAPVAIDYVVGGGTDRRAKETPGYEYTNGVIFGHVVDPRATTVEIQLPGGAPLAHATIGKNGFFITDLPATAWWANQNDDAPIGPATARDARGQVVATSPALPVPSITNGQEGATPATLVPGPDDTTTPST